LAEARRRPRGEQFAQLNSELSRAVVQFTALLSTASAFGGSVNEFRQLELQLTRANNAARGTAQTFAAMSEASRNFALFTKAQATDAANALFFLSQAGFEASQSLNAMTGVLILSQATMQDVAFTSDLVASTLKTYGLASVEATRVANLFAAAQTNSLASLDKLAFSLRQVGPVAAAFNQDIEETTAFLSELYNVGLRGEQAGTALRNVMLRLAKPVGEARDVLEKYNIETKDAAGNTRALRNVLIDLKTAGLTQSELLAVFGTEALAGGIAAMNAAASGSFDRLLASISGTNTAFELAQKQMNTLDGALSVLSSAIKELQISFGEALAPTLISISLYFRDLVVAFRQLPPETKQLIAVFASLATGLALTGVAIQVLVFAFGGLLTGYQKIITTANLVTVAVTKTGLALSSLFSSLVVGPAVAGLTGVFNGIASSVLFVEKVFIGLARIVAATTAVMTVSLAQMSVMLLKIPFNLAAAGFTAISFAANTLVASLRLLIPVYTALVAAVLKVRNAFFALVFANAISGFGLLGAAAGAAANAMVALITAFAKVRVAMRAIAVATIAAPLYAAVGAAGALRGILLGLVATVVSLVAAMRNFAAVAITASFFNMAAGATNAFGALSRVVSVFGALTTTINNAAKAMRLFITASVVASIMQFSVAGSAVAASMNLLRGASVAAGTALATVGTIFARVTANAVVARTAMIALRTAAIIPVAAAVVGVGGLVYAFTQYIAQLVRARVEQRKTFEEARAEIRKTLVAAAGTDSTGLSRRLTEAVATKEYANAIYGGRESTVELIGALQQSRRQFLTIEQEIATAKRALTTADAKFAEYVDLRNRLLSSAQTDLSSIIAGVGDAGGGAYGSDTEVQRAFDTLKKGLTTEQIAEFEALIAAQDELLVFVNQARAQASATGKELKEAVITLVTQLSIGNFDNVLSEFGIDADTAKELREFVSKNADYVASQLGLAFAESGQVDWNVVLKGLASTAGAPEALREALNRRNEQTRLIYLNALQQETAKAVSDGREIAAQLARALAAQSESIAEAINLTREAQALDLESLIEKFIDDRKKALEIAREGDDAGQLDVLGREFGASLAEMISFSSAEESLREALAQGKGTDELAAIVESILKQNIAVVEAILSAAGAQAAEIEKVAGIVRETMTVAATNLLNSLKLQAAESAAEIKGIQTRFGKGGGKGKTPQELQRDFESTLREIESSMRRAQRTLLDLDPTIDLSARINMLLEFDIADIKAKYDNDIAKLRNELADLEEKFAGQPKYISTLRERYTELISQVEAAKAAEIAYTNTFTAMSERRNEAIDRQIDALRNLSQESSLSGGRILLGLKAGLLLYQKDLKTTVDNVAQATVSTLDGLAEAVGAFVTGTGDAFEILRQSILSSLRELVTNATKRMLQQVSDAILNAITGVTTNIAGAVAGQGTPASGGVGGIISRVVSTLFGGANITASTSGLGAAAAAMNPAEGATAQLGLVLTNVVASIQAIFTQFLQSLSVALNTVLSQVGGTPVSGTGKGGGFFGFLTSIFPFLGAMDAGGSIPRGSFALVGERRPELVAGPANVLGGRDTAALLSRQPVVNVAPPNVVNVVVQDPKMVQRYLSTEAGRRDVLNIVNSSRNR
jgi:TP901 family phage tail tape measure protein